MTDTPKPPATVEGVQALIAATQKLIESKTPPAPEPAPASDAEAAAAEAAAAEAAAAEAAAAEAAAAKAAPEPAAVSREEFDALVAATSALVEKLSAPPAPAPAPKPPQAPEPAPAPAPAPTPTLHERITGKPVKGPDNSFAARLEAVLPDDTKDNK